MKVAALELYIARSSFGFGGFSDRVWTWVLARLETQALLEAGILIAAQPLTMREA